jgi:hypothetical protein
LQLAAIQGDEASIEALQQLGEEAKQKVSALVVL